MTGLNESSSFTNAINRTLHRLATSFVLCSDSWPSDAFTVTILYFLFIASLTGNVLVVAIFYRNKSLRTTVNYFIVNMAISDLLIPVFFLPWKISQYYVDGIWLVDGIFGSLLCKITHNIWQISVSVSVFSMLAIATDRFHAVVFPMKLPLFSHKRCQIIIALTWVVSSAFTAPYLNLTKMISSDTDLHCLMERNPIVKITWMFFFCLNFVSGIVLTMLYITVMLFLYRQKRNLRLATEVVRKRAARNRKISSMLLLIVTTFYFGWIPLYFLSVNIFLNVNYRLSCFIIFIFQVLPTVSIVTNPIVYFTFNEGYRQGLMEMLCCTWYSRSVSRQSEGSVENDGQMNNAIELHEH